MKKKIFYWSPCLNPVGTVISTINSSISISKYSQEFEVSILNTCGEWDKFKSEFNREKIEVIDIGPKYYKFLPKNGFIKSRLSYILIFLISFIPLLTILKKKKPNLIIAHLITSLPILIFRLFNFDTKLILRISGMPKLNFLRKNFWKFCSSKIDMITCPSIELKSKLIKLKILNEIKIFYLPDAVINISKFRKQLNTNIQLKNLFSGENTVFLAAGRLTKQKNFEYLIEEFSKFYFENKNSRLVILGDGEEKQKLKKSINEKKLNNVIYLLGKVENVTRYMKDSHAFILSSKWEEMGFVIIEAALSNLFIISSNCPNGPSEFLNYGIGGILFESNQKDALYKSLVKYNQITEEVKFTNKVRTKKNSINFTMFRHFRILNKILSQK
tara:strand:+ start:6465 stop:7622 length:1158 start_codon:yes stop_codon:yes gene_type:complete